MTGPRRLYWEVHLVNANSPEFMEVGETRTFEAEEMNQYYSEARSIKGGTYVAWQSQAANAGYY